MPDTYARMRQLIGTSAEWATNDLVIGLGEIAVERTATDYKMKVGNGTARYSQLPYATGGDFVKRAELTTTSTGTTQAGRVPQLNASGRLDASLLNMPGSLHFRGLADPTGAAPTGAVAGDYWLANVAGTAAASWTGIAGQAIAVNDQLIWTGTAWTYLHPAAPVTGYLPLDGSQPMLGALALAAYGAGQPAAAHAIRKDYFDAHAIDAELDFVTVPSLDALTLLTSRPAVVISTCRVTAGDHGGGAWVFVDGDQSANVAADLQKGLWVAPNAAPTGASGAWQRQFSGALDARWFGLTVAAADNTVALNRAIVMAGRSGHPLFIAGGEWVFTGTVLVTVDNVAIIGNGILSTKLRFENLALDSVKIGWQAAEIGGIQLRDLTITHTLGAKTQGIGLALDRVRACRFDSIMIDHAWNGFYAQRFNGVELHNCVIIPNQTGANRYGIYLGAPGATNADRSDAITFFGQTVSCAYSGADCFQWDGPVYTVRWHAGALMGGRYGLLIKNSFANATGFFPQYGFFNNLEIDGASQSAVRIEGGNHFVFVQPSWGNNQTTGGEDTFVVLPDSTQSRTREIIVVGGVIGAGSSAKRAANISANNVHFSGTDFHGASVSGAGLFPVVEFGAGGGGAATLDCTMSGGMCGVPYGGPPTPSYGVVLNSGVQRVIISGVTFNGCQTGSVQDSSGSMLNRVIGCIGHDGKILPDVASGTIYRSAPLTAWGLDFTQSTLTIANGSSGVIPVGSGLVLVNDQSVVGHVGLYLTGNGQAMVETSGSSWVAPTTTPAAGKASIANSGTDVRIYNNLGASATFGVALLRTRAAY